LIDVNQPVPESVMKDISQIEGVLGVRTCEGWPK
jgi:hypothetical protein